MKLKHLLAIPLALAFISGCQKSSTVQPVMHYAGYAADYLAGFHEAGATPAYELEGDEACIAVSDSTLELTVPATSNGCMLWFNDLQEGDIQLEYQVSFSDSSGMHVAYLFAEKMKDSEVRLDSSIQAGSYEYNARILRSYQVAVHCYDPEYTHHDQCRMRKNPGQLLMSHSDADPCPYNQTYLIDFIKTGNRLQFFVDEARIHDVRDKGVFQPAMSAGKIGLWFEGTGVEYTVLLSRVNLFRLTPL